MKLLRDLVVLVAVMGAMGQVRAQSPSPVVSNVELSNVRSTSALITFSSGTPVFAGVSYKAPSGPWVTVNEAYGVRHSVELKGLTPGTRYSYIAWASGAPPVPASTFTTTASSAILPVLPGSVPFTNANGREGPSPVLLIAVPVVIVLGAVFAAVVFFRRRAQRNRDKEQAGSGFWMPGTESGYGRPAPGSRVVRGETIERAGEEDGFGRSNAYLTSGTIKALEVDGDLVRTAQEYTGLTDDTALIEEALKALIRNEASRRLVAPPTTEPELDDVQSRRTP